MEEQQLNLNGRKIGRYFRGLCIGIGLYFTPPQLEIFQTSETVM